MKKKNYIILGAIFAAIVLIAIILIVWYMASIQAPKKQQSEDVVVEISSGTSTSNIVRILKENDVIKSELATKIYIKLHEITKLQAGKYKFDGNNSVEEVLDTISNGKVMDETVTITFKEGKNMRYIASTIAEKTNNTANDVYAVLKDEEYILSIIDKYWFLSNEIQNSSIYYPLEGYLYPDTYTFENSDVDVKTIFEKMLDETGKVLAKYKSGRNNESSDVASDGQEKYSAHQVLTMASIVELEGNSAEDRAKIARVIYNRLAKNMSLGSDVTTYYAIRVDMGDRNLTSKEINTYNAYNTRGPDMAGKLPVGPISNASEESINAVLRPAEGNYLYFVADKNGDMYFTNTYEEHQETINLLKRKGLWYEY